MGTLDKVAEANQRRLVIGQFANVVSQRNGESIFPQLRKTEGNT
jgi:hypothetical protein